MIRSAISIGGLLFLGLIAGCGGAPSTANPGKPPPHEGRLVLLPDGAALIEVVKKEGPAPITAEVSFYIFVDGSYAPIRPQPQSGVLILDGNQQVTLQVEGDALVTPTGPILFGDRDVDGTLKIELDGETREIPLGIR